MTAKEMAHWERWHRLGQRRFQWRYTILLFVILGAGPALAELLRDQNPHWWDKLAISAVLSIGAFFLNGWIWKKLVAEYLRQSASTQDNRT